MAGFITQEMYAAGFTTPAMGSLQMAYASPVCSLGTCISELLTELVSKVKAIVASFSFFSPSSQVDKGASEYRGSELIRNYNPTPVFEGLDRLKTFSSYQNFLVEEGNTALGRVQDRVNGKADPRVYPPLGRALTPDTAAAKNQVNSKDNKINDFEPVDFTYFDKEIRDRVWIDNGQQQVEFKHRQRGYCRGMSEWFIYLYLNAVFELKPKNDEDFAKIIRAVGFEFKDGAKEAPTALHSIGINEGELLGLEVGDKTKQGEPFHDNCNKNFKRLPLVAIHESKLDQTNALEDLENLPPNVYMVHSYHHAMVYVKINNELGFFFNPDGGITEIRGKQTGTNRGNLNQLLLNSLRVRDNMNCFEPGKCRIAFYPVTQQESANKEAILESI